MEPLPETRKLKQVIRNLEAAKFIPIFVGGLALTLFGSDRVTFDCDLVSKRPKNMEEAKSLIRAMYKAKCYYVSNVDKDGNPVAYIDNANVAASRIMIDKPDTVFFWNPEMEMKIDILLDFPLKASDLLAAAENKKLDRTTTIKIASLQHLKEMKEIALTARKNPKDWQDLDFIKKKLGMA
ncbi:MAG: hypothetical protein QME81_16195 [bacterium]|nr:hypothetical protein [bacterium]